MTKKELFEKADGNKLETKKKAFKELGLSERIYFIYNNVSLEGVNITEKEIENVILREGEMENVTDQSSLIIGNSKAIDIIMKESKSHINEISEEFIKRLYCSLYYGKEMDETKVYRTEPGNVLMSKEMAPDAKEIPHLMFHFTSQMKLSRKMFHPIEYAAICHKRIIDMQPFKKNNGIIARLLMNFILLQEGYEMTTIDLERKDEYRNTLLASRQILNPEVDKLVKIIVESVIFTQENRVF